MELLFIKKLSLSLFHDGGRYHIETSPLITAPVMKELRAASLLNSANTFSSNSIFNTKNTRFSIKW